jgi:hypothetical protein
MERRIVFKSHQIDEPPALGFSFNSQCMELGWEYWDGKWDLEKILAGKMGSRFRYKVN